MLAGQDRAIARLALVLAKAPFQVDETLVEEVLSADRCEERFIRILAWVSFSGARRFAQRIAEAAGRSHRADLSLVKREIGSAEMPGMPALGLEA